ncbi:glycosyltransferase [Rhizobium paknamense]|uniref:Succinoglycan biosynthesis protein ExoL n=1 Tax=Rhizobium paknamense TaxID=1206817 RepID=A0ABU0IL54_9HYPH|nr:glycosyltransferase [Rhizobium paknamense]MDQ0458377.1 succinoglycan biosynthesis protein ExoL [Rhizobium paknamense]
MGIRVLYLAHDLADPAIRRRVLMLVAGGAEVMLAGFRRDSNALAAVEGIQPIELGLTADGRFGQRASAVIKAAFGVRRMLGHLPRPDVILARNLEMLAVGRRARHAFGAPVPLVYECLDIHRLVLREDGLGKALRALEGRLSRQASLLITSSPAFVEHYFHRLSSVDLPVMLMENKVLDLSGESMPSLNARRPAAGQPWRIGWFGALRCARSFDALAAFSRAMQGRVQIELRGRPAYGVMPDFDARVAAEPYMTFHGAYRNPEDLARIYGEVQFAWAIDFYEEGQNSDWLLPNRLYESCRHGALPIALSGTETGRTLQRHGLGFCIETAGVEALSALFETMTGSAYDEAFAALAAADARLFTADAGDCRALVERLRTLPDLSTRLKPSPADVKPYSPSINVDVHDG